MIAESTIRQFWNLLKEKGRQKSLKDVLHQAKVSLASMTAQDKCRVSVLLTGVKSSAKKLY